MRVRGASGRDIKRINELYQEYDFKLDVDHLELLIVVEDDNGDIIGAGSLVTIIEAAFVIDKSFRAREKIEAVKLIIETGSEFTKNQGYDLMHGFVQDQSVVHMLKKHFEFQDSIGANLVKFVV